MCRQRRGRSLSADQAPEGAGGKERSFGAAGSQRAGVVVDVRAPNHLSQSRWSS